MSVHDNRKKELLKEARASRLAWIDGPVTSQSRAGIGLLKSTRAAQLVPSAIPILTALYEGEDMDARVQAKLSDKLSSETSEDETNHSNKPALFTPYSGSPNNNNNNNNAKTAAELKVYREFCEKLKAPTCAVAVQGMRNFCRKFQDISLLDEQQQDQQQDGAGDGDGDGDGDLLTNLSKAFRSYLLKTLDTLQLLWTNTPKEVTQQPLETFLFLKCHGKIWSELEKANKEKNHLLESKMGDLEFLTPKHLDIPSLAEEDILILLENPIHSMLKLSGEFGPDELPVHSFPISSPFDKLQVILEVYRGINDALKTAMSRKNSDAIPSADDVLPTLILTVLKAQPKQLVSILRFIEVFASPENLRGEAGYAFTNLYGAVQFLLDFPVDGEGESLSISAQEFKAGLEQCRAAAERRTNTITDALLGPLQDESSPTTPAPLCSIPVSEVRAARERGEDVNLDWALSWRKRRLQQEEEEENNANDGATDHNSLVQAASGETSKEQPPADPPLASLLPKGFHRNYSFLSIEPEQVRVADLPKLLEEYRMLVRATESLLAERTTRENTKNKERAEERRKQLEAAVVTVDPSLLRSRRGTDVD